MVVRVLLCSQWWRNIEGNWKRLINVENNSTKVQKERAGTQTWDRDKIHRKTEEQFNIDTNTEIIGHNWKLNAKETPKPFKDCRSPVLLALESFAVILLSFFLLFLSFGRALSDCVSGRALETGSWIVVIPDWCEKCTEDLGKTKPSHIKQSKSFTSSWHNF